MPQTPTTTRPSRPAALIVSTAVVLGLLALLPAGALAQASSSGGGGDDFLGIAKGLESQGAAIAQIIGALLLIGTIFYGWVQNSMKIVGIGVVMALIAGFAVSGSMWKAGQSTADSISGAGQIQQR
ncbi:hypothetical protein DSM112329_02940 [Paraconexibacter sp. AEG42_29]|uniref:TrbC/VirB2 family protein n=1 Tax=Paraconexibacter sp. AEG42_29 TaxID=2997339 RepID=A0AAU7AWK9_9ACTN